LSYACCLHLEDGQSLHYFAQCNDVHCWADCDFSVDCNYVLGLSLYPCVDCLDCVPSSLDSQGCHSSRLHWCCQCSYMRCCQYTSFAKQGDTFLECHKKLIISPMLIERPWKVR
jgi:hypothetical protein